MDIRIKKKCTQNVPYLILGLYATKLMQTYRLAEGTDFATKVLHLGEGFSKVFESPFPSFVGVDLLLGLVCGVLLRLAVWIRGKNRKKYRKDMEYGSARWGNTMDIRPFVDEKADNNVILTQTESLTMASRPKQPKYARNKNVLVIGGSGSGKTRFWLKPNLMQCHSSNVVTDPNGTHWTQSSFKTHWVVITELRENV